MINKHNHLNWAGEPRCGLAPPPRAHGHSRIINGSEAVPHSIPWQAEIGYNNWTYNGTRFHKWAHQCGGTILSKRYVLTAGHCSKCYAKCEDSFLAFCANDSDCNMQTCCIITSAVNFCLPLCDSGHPTLVSVKEHNITDDSDGQYFMEICNCIRK